MRENISSTPSGSPRWTTPRAVGHNHLAVCCTFNPDTTCDQGFVPFDQHLPFARQPPPTLCLSVWLCWVPRRGERPSVCERRAGSCTGVSAFPCKGWGEERVASPPSCRGGLPLRMNRPLVGKFTRYTGRGKSLQDTAVRPLLHLQPSW